MNSMKNRVSLIGNLGGAPEIKKASNGNEVATFSLATNTFYKNQQGENVQDTQWHRVVVFGKRVEIVKKYIDKGSKIAIDGRLVTNSYETKEGEKRYQTEVVAGEILLLDQKPEAVA
jgi:single-strand DNA-binding protein